MGQEQCREELATRLLDAQEIVSCRELSVIAQCDLLQTIQVVEDFCKQQPTHIGRVHVVIQQEMGKTKSCDPRARTISLRVDATSKPETAQASDEALSDQLYGVFYKDQQAQPPQDHDQQSQHVYKLALSFWNQEQRVRNEAFDTHSEALQSLWNSSVQSSEARMRHAQANHGAKTASAFDGFGSSSKLATSSSTFGGKKRFGGAASSSSSSFFKSNATSSSSSAKAKPKDSLPPRYLSKPSSKQQHTKDNEDEQEDASSKSHAIDMSKVLSVDSSDEDSEDDDGPVFVKKTTAASQSKSTSKDVRKRNRVVDEDDEEEEDEEEDEQSHQTKSSAVGSPRAKSSKAVRNVKRKLSTSPAVHVRSPPSKEQEEDDDNELTVPTTKSVVVTKTRINEQGYMVTEKTVETVQLTPKEIEEARQQVQSKRRLQRQHQQRQAAIAQQELEHHQHHEDNDKPSKAKPSKTKKPRNLPQQRKINDFFTRK